MLGEIIIAGFGGQGVLTLGEFLAMAGIIEGKNVTWVPTYGQEKRGGDANSAVVISDDEVVSPIVENPTALLCMNEKSIHTFSASIVPGGIIFYNSSMAAPYKGRDDIEVIAVPCNEIAVELGNERSANMILLGAYLEYSKLLKKESIIAAMKEKMGDKKEKVIAANALALEKGAEFI
jgi:2-oxoglutarate ferredoxin oxidoreductase subunit gamma